MPLPPQHQQEETSAGPPGAAPSTTESTSGNSAPQETRDATPIRPLHEKEALSASPPVPEPRNRMDSAPAEDAVPYVTDGVVYSSYAGTSGRTSRTSYSINREEVRESHSDECL